MPDTIRDGKGLGFLAQVTSRNKLAVDSVSTDIAVDENKRGNSYNINTGVITLTDAADTPVLYVKNNEDEDLVIKTEKPVWAREDYEFKHWKTLSGRADFTSCCAV